MKSSVIIAVRHFETEKNRLGVHGESDLRGVTERGYLQAERVAKVIRSYVPPAEAITHFITPQAQESANLLSQLTGIPIEPALTLKRFDMGVASGISHDELRKLDPYSAMSLELFRARVIDLSKRRLSGGEDYIALERRLLEWWAHEGSARCPNRVVVGSNSTLIMLSNLLQEKLPSGGEYMCFGIPNGGYRVWTLDGARWSTLPDLDLSRWPELECRSLATAWGRIQSTYYYKGWHSESRACIIVPGYFGNSRLGPYGLFCRLARALAFEGYESITVDYLGSGESSPASRTFASDVYSVEAVLRKCQSEVVLIGHSIGSAVVAEICRKYPRVVGVALAPLCGLEEMAKRFLSSEELMILKETGTVSRRGIRLELTYVNAAEQAWREGANRLKAVVSAKEDQYTEGFAGLGAKVARFVVEGADHNFSSGNASDTLIELIVAIVCGE